MDQKFKKIRVAHIIPDSGNRDRQLLFEFITLALRDTCILHFFILTGNVHFKHFLAENNIPFTDMNFFPKNILSIVARAWHLRKKLAPFDVVHTHYHDANILGLLAGRFARVPKCIYTRHHNSYFHDTGNAKNVRINKLFNKLAHVIIAPSQSVAHTLIKLESVAAKKVATIHHPFSLTDAGEPTPDSIAAIRKKHEINTNTFTIGAVSSFQYIKGTDLIVDAYEIILKSQPNAILILANAHGPDTELMKEKIKNLPSGRVILIPYENDILSLYKTFDAFVHVPRSASSEAFGQVYVESMALGIPGVFTLSGVLPEIADHMKNCMLVDYDNPEAIASAVLEIAKNQAYSDKLAANAVRTVTQKFSLEAFREKLMNLYAN